MRSQIATLAVISIAVMQLVVRNISINRILYKEIS